MTKVIIAVLVCAFATTFVVSAYLPSGSAEKALERFQNSSEWEIIGQIGEKVFLKHNESVNWMGGRAVCKSEDLEYAVFEDVNEYRFIYANATAPEGLWVSAVMRGIETYRPLAFNWDTNGQDISNDISYHMFSDHWICLYFSSSDHLYSDFCLSGRHQTLCQLRV